MRAERVVGNERLGDEIGALRADAFVDVLAEVAVRPTVEAAVLDRGQVIGNEVAAEFVAFIGDGPQEPTLRRPSHAVGVAQAGRENAVVAGLWVDFPDRGAAFLGGHAVLADIAVRADGGVEQLAVGTGDDIFGPVVVDRPGRQIDELASSARDRRIAVLIIEAHDGVGVGNVKTVANQGHAEGRVEALQENRAEVGDTITVAVTQQADAVGAGDAGAGYLLHLFHDPALDALAVFRLWRRVRFGNQHVAIRQDVEPAGVIEITGESSDPGAGDRLRRDATRPALGRRDVHGRQQALGGRRQGRRGAGAGGDR